MGKQSRVRVEKAERRLLLSKSTMFDKISEFVHFTPDTAVIVVNELRDYIMDMLSAKRMVSGFLHDQLLAIPVGVRPPFDNVFIEVKNLLDTKNGGDQYYGIFVHSIDIKSEGYQTSDEIEEGEETVLIIKFFDLEIKPRLKFGATRLQSQVYLKAGGMYSSFDVMDTELEGVASNAPEATIFMHNIMIHIALTVFALLNCRNIKMVDQLPSVELNKSHQRLFGKPMTKYKTLAISGFSKASHESSEQKEYQGLVSLHIRRGNFATYTDDAPLFGKFTGTFWRPATVVGDEKRGVVAKDYKVLPPEDIAS